MAADSTSPGPSGPLRSFRESLHSSPDFATKATQWVDGSEPISESYDDEEEGDFGDRRLSKAERKRLRKQKRAA